MRRSTVENTEYSADSVVVEGEYSAVVGGEESPCSGRVSETPNVR